MKNKPGNLVLITLGVYFYFLLFLVVSGFAQSVQLRDRTRYVENKKIMNDICLTLSEIKIYGGMEPANNEEIFCYPFDMAFDNDGNRYILDHKGPYVLVYNKSGDFLYRFGKKGQGPGELSFPWGISIDIENNVYITEWYGGQVLVLSNKGKYIKRIHPKVPCDMPGIKVMNDGKLLGGLSPFPDFIPEENPPFSEPVLVVCSPNGDRLRQFGSLKHFKYKAMTKSGNAVFYTVDADDNIFVTYRFQNRIEKYNANGKLLLHIKRKLNFKEPFKVNQDITYNKNGGVQGSGLPIMNVVSCGIAVDSQNRIWVLTMSRQPQYERFCEVAENEHDYAKLEVFDSDGIMLAEIPVKENIEPYVSCLYINDDHLFILNANTVSVTEYLVGTE
ncbi:NHL repeat-containing protein [bacterium]|nr:NHL repeat-containing protein [bacterium]